MYLILPVHWEYDDERYHTGNYGPSYEKPSQFCATKEEAEANVLRLNFEKLKQMRESKYDDLGAYGWDGPMHNLGYAQEAYDILESHGIDTSYYLDLSPLSDTDLRVLAHYLTGFYEIHEL